jgi:DNA-binding PadR family transcriptional regulator
MPAGLCVDVEPNAFPGWLPDEARRYLLHTEAGVTIRALARGEGCHPSTVSRQVRRMEARREDPLIDEALSQLVPAGQDRSDPSQRCPNPEDPMSAHPRNLKPVAPPAPDETTVEREARRILRRLSEAGSVLVAAPELPKAVVLREIPGGKSTRTAVVERTVAQAFALKDWIARTSASGRVATYEITAAGRAALKRLLAEDMGARDGFAEAPALFAEQHRDWGERHVDEDGAARRIRYNVAESPLAALARRRDRDGEPFLPADLVAAGERLREDFELAQMGPRVTQNWDRFLTAGTDRGQFGAGGAGDLRGGGPEAARARVVAALAELGPGLGDMVLRVCCFLEGLETAEKRMGWSARSGKIVLRIALLRLRRYYDEAEGRYGALIG